MPPPILPVPAADPLRGDIDGLLGFRTPCFVISPFARREHVSHVVLDHTSGLKMIEWRWNLPALSVRDDVANNLATVLDFSAPQVSPVKEISVPSGPFGHFHARVSRRDGRRVVPLAQDGGRLQLAG